MTQQDLPFPDIRPGSRNEPDVGSARRRQRSSHGRPNNSGVGWLYQMIAAHAFAGVFGLSMLACLILGGGTRPGYLGDAVLELMAIPLLIWAVGRQLQSQRHQRYSWALGFCALLALLPLLQLVPFPPQVWQASPAREIVRSTYVLLGMALPWQPISVTPHDTAQSLAGLLAPMAIFLGALSLSPSERRTVSLGIIAFGMLSVVLGMLQVAQGEASALRMFPFTNVTEAVGFFANRNHYSALLYSVLLLAGAWSLTAATSASGSSRAKTFATGSILKIVSIVLVLLLCVMAQAMARSRAGLGLSVLGLLGALAMAFVLRGNAKGSQSFTWIAGASLLAVVFAGELSLYRLMERFKTDPLADTRVVITGNAWAAAKAYFPWGSGLGSFVEVYATFETPKDALINAYVNHAHNDVLEIAVEAGLPGLMLMLAFVAWLLVSSARIWRQRSHEGLEVDHALELAATLIVSLLLLHSLVDYPLRTAAMLAVLAFSCAIITTSGVGLPPQPSVLPSQGSDRGGPPSTQIPKPSPRVEPRGPSRQNQPGADAGPDAVAGQRWGQDVDWPDAWSTGQVEGAAQKPKAPASAPPGKGRKLPPDT